VRDGKIWGRGATDIKGGLAALVCALGRLPRRSFAGTLIVSASIGEEHMEGAALRSVVAHTRPDFTMICEPTGCQLGIGQKGRTEIWIQVHGRPAHTSRPELGDNAIYRAVEMIPVLKGLPIHSDPILGNGVMELVEIISNPFPGECTVPYDCRMRYDRRLVSGETRDSLMREVRAALERFPSWEVGFQPGILNTYTGIELRGEHFYASWLHPEDSPWLVKCRKGLQKAGISPQTMIAPYCTNGSLTAGEFGIPTVIFGPSTISLAHVVDENVEIAELVHAYQGIQSLVQALSLP
jgi:acetylornithine deacetylase/succinyl-diaminopimelate desuccinylase-like protein